MTSLHNHFRMQSKSISNYYSLNIAYYVKMLIRQNYWWYLPDQDAWEHTYCSERCPGKKNAEEDKLTGRGKAAESASIN